MHANYTMGMYLALVHGGDQNVYDSHLLQLKVWGLETDTKTHKTKYIITQ